MSLSELVENAVRQNMPKAAVQWVNAEVAVDHEGEPIVRVTIVSDQRKSQLDPAEAASVSRHIQNALTNNGYREFPIVEFLDLADAGDRRPAAA